MPDDPTDLQSNELRRDNATDRTLKEASYLTRRGRLKMRS